MLIALLRVGVVVLPMQGGLGSCVGMAVCAFCSLGFNDCVGWLL